MSTDFLKSLRDRRLQAWEGAKEIAERSARENRPMSGEEQRQWDAYNAEVDSLDGRIKAVLDGERRAKEAEEAFNAVRSPEETRVATGDKELETQLRKWMVGEARGNAANGRAFEVKLPSAYEQRDLAKSSNTVPVTFVNRLYQYLIDYSSVRQANPTVISTGSGEDMTIPRSTAEGVATWVAEAGAIGESDPTLSSVTLPVYKAAKLIDVSSELVADVGFDLLGFLAQHMGRNVAVLADTAYVVGTGTGQPTGFVTDASVGRQQATGNTTSFTTAGSADDLFEMFHSVIPGYRRNAVWLANDAWIKIVRKLKDTTNQYLWQPGLQAGMPDTLLGKPIYDNPNLASPVGASNKPAAFGDFSGFYIREVSSVRLERSDDYRFGNDQVSWRVIYRTGSKLVDTNAVKMFQNSAT